MNKDVVEFFGGNALPQKADLASALSNFAAAKSSLLGKSLLRLARSGHWVFGQNNEPLPENVRVIVNPASIASGYIAWYNGEPEHEYMKPITEGPVDISTLPADLKSGTTPPGKDIPSGRGWETQLAADMVTEDEVPLQLQYKTSSKGGVRAMLNLAGDIAKAVAEDERRSYPVVELKTDSYTHKNREYGKIYVPDFKVVGWLDSEGKPVTGEADAKPDLI